jgi:tetratricopeptide (TPR) repeat protein
MVALIIVVDMILGIGAYYAVPKDTVQLGGTSGAPVGGGLGLIDQGNAAYDNGDYVAAIGYYEKALEQRPSDANVMVDLGTAYYYKRPSDPTRAVYYYDKAIQVDAKFPNAHFNKAIVLSSISDYTGAVQSLNDLLKLVPSGPQADKARQMLKEYEPLAKATPASQTAAPQAASQQTSGSTQTQPSQGASSPISGGFNN